MSDWAWIEQIEKRAKYLSSFSDACTEFNDGNDMHKLLTAIRELRKMGEAIIDEPYLAEDKKDRSNLIERIYKIVGETLARVAKGKFE